MSWTRTKGMGSPGLKTGPISMREPRRSWEHASVARVEPMAGDRIPGSTTIVRIVGATGSSGN